MTRIIKRILRIIAYVPVYILGVIFFGITYLLSWLADFILEDK